LQKKEYILTFLLKGTITLAKNIWLNLSSFILLIFFFIPYSYYKDVD
jgi:hypothetical protein